MGECLLTVNSLRWEVTMRGIFGKLAMLQGRHLMKRGCCRGKGALMGAVKRVWGALCGS